MVAVALAAVGAKWRHSWQRKVFPSTGYMYMYWRYLHIGGIPVVPVTEIGSTVAVL